jgi:type I restriction enzyme M protein
LLEEAKNDAGKVTKLSARARLTSIRDDPDAKAELKMLTRAIDLIEDEAEAKRAAKEAEEALYESVLGKYLKLSEDEIKTLVVEDKWLRAVKDAVQGELDRVSQTLTGRVRELAERYATPLGELASEVEALSGRVEEHLKKMGFAS